MTRLSQRAAKRLARAHVEAEVGVAPADFACFVKDGETGWAFTLADDDTTSYVHGDGCVEWYGTSWEPRIPRPNLSEVTPAARRTFVRLLAGETIHVGAGPRGQSVRRHTARELLDAGLCDWTDFDNRGARPDFETVSDVRLYLPTCDGCRQRFAPRQLSRGKLGTDLTLCATCDANLVVHSDGTRSIEGSS